MLLVMEDEAPDTVRRSSAVAKRVRAEVGSALSWLGYRVIDEETRWLPMRESSLTTAVREGRLCAN